MKTILTPFQTKTTCLHVSTWSARRVAVCLVLLFLASIAIKLIALGLEPGLGRDACLYLLIAEIWGKTGSYGELLRAVPQADRIPPLLPFLIKSTATAGVPAETAGLFLNIVLGSLIPLVGFGIAFETTRNKKIALATAFLLAVHPGINDLSTEIQRDAPYLFFSGCAVWLALAGLLRKKLLPWCGAGIALAFALLLRYEAAELLLLVSAMVFVFALARRLSWKQAVSYGAALVVCMGIAFYSLALLMGTDKIVSSYSKYIAFEAASSERQLSGTSESGGK